MNASPSMFLMGNGPKTRESAESPDCPHNEDVLLGYPGRSIGVVKRQVLAQVRLLLLLSVHQEGAVTHLDLVPRYGHDALYQVLLPPFTLSKTTTSPRSGSAKR